MSVSTSELSSQGGDIVTDVESEHEDLSKFKVDRWFQGINSLGDFLDDDAASFHSAETERFTVDLDDMHDIVPSSDGEDDAETMTAAPRHDYPDDTPHYYLRSSRSVTDNDDAETVAYSIDSVDEFYADHECNICHNHPPLNACLELDDVWLQEGYHILRLVTVEETWYRCGQCERLFHENCLEDADLIPEDARLDSYTCHRCW